jgi:hypothetical protein
MVATAPAVRRALAGALLALCVLAAALFVWVRRAGEAPTRPAEEPVSPATAQLREPVAAEPVPGSDPEPAQDAPPEQPEALAPSVEPQPEARRAAAEREPLQSGSLHIEADLDPLLGEARLLVGSGGSLALDAPAAPAAAELAGGWLRDCGAYVPGGRDVHGLRPGPLRVLIAQPGGPRVELDGLWVLAGETLRVVVPAPDTARIALRVLAPSGAPLLGARVALVGDRPGGARDALGGGAASPLGATGPDGVVVVHPPIGAWRLRVTASGPADHVFAPYVLDGESWPGDEPRELEIVLTPGLEIAGDLLDPDALGFAGRRIAGWSPIGPGPAPRAALELGLPLDVLATVAAAVVTPERRFAFRGLAAEAVLELARGDGFAPPVRARAGQQGVSVTQLAGATLELEVLAADTRAPLADFTAELAGTWPGRTRRGSDGRLAWSGLRPFAAAERPAFADLPESEDLELALWADGHDRVLAPPLRLRTGETTRAPPVLLRPLPSVHVLVVDAQDRRPIEGAQCALEALLPELAVGRASSADVSDAAGRARLTATANNAAELLVRCAGYAPRRLRTPAPNLPDQPLEVALARGALVRARVLDEERNPVRALVLRRRTAVETGDALAVEHEVAWTDGDGVVEFRDLEAGSVALAACALPRSDVQAPPPAELLSWTPVGVGQGGEAEVELAALRAPALELELAWQGRALPGAVLRLSADTAAFSAPHDDARTFLTGPALRADADGHAALGPLYPGLYALRVEHPFVPGFARTLLEVGGMDGVRELELASERQRGEVVRDGERVFEGRAVVWAHGPYHEQGLDVVPGAVLRELVPEPIFLGEVELSGGVFDLPVPAGVELIVTAHDSEASGDYYVKVPLGQRDPITVAVERSVELDVVAEVRAKRTRVRELGVVGYNTRQPWGRGLIATKLEGYTLSLGDLPPGTWRLCLVELAGGQLVVERGDWSEYQLDGGRQRVRVDWRRR